MFLSMGYIQKQQLRGVLKNNRIYTFKIFKGIYNEFLHSKKVICSIYSKSLIYGKKLKDLILQRQALAGVCKIDVLKDFAKLTGKHVYQTQCLMKLQACSFITKETPAQNFSSEFREIFKNTLFKDLFQATTSDSK